MSAELERIAEGIEIVQQVGRNVRDAIGEDKALVVSRILTVSDMDKFLVDALRLMEDNNIQVPEQLLGAKVDPLWKSVFITGMIN